MRSTAVSGLGPRNDRERGRFGGGSTDRPTCGVDGGGVPGSLSRARAADAGEPCAPAAASRRCAALAGVCRSRLRSAAAPSTTGRDGIPKTHALDAAGSAGSGRSSAYRFRHGNKGERKTGLLPHNAYGTRFLTRRLHAHQLRSQLLRPPTWCGPRCRKARRPGRARSPFVPRLFPSGQWRRNQPQVLQTSPSRGRLWLCPAARVSSPG
jgi:hypothetical protein